MSFKICAVPVIANTDCQTYTPAYPDKWLWIIGRSHGGFLCRKLSDFYQGRGRGTPRSEQAKWQL